MERSSVCGAEFRVWGLWVYGLGFRDLSLGFRGLGLRIHVEKSMHGVKRRPFLVTQKYTACIQSPKIARNPTYPDLKENALKAAGLS